MSGSPPQVVKAASLRDVVALVPFQCGFHPRHSVVVLSLRGPRLRIGQVTRLDLPAPQDVPDLVAQVASFVARDQGRASVVAVYDDQEWDAHEPPHLALVTALLEELERAGVPARDAAYVSPERYWSYLCRMSGCCPPEGGSVTEAMTSPMAASLVLAGMAPLPTREDLAARVGPAPPTLTAAVAECAWGRLARQAAVVDAADREVHSGSPESADGVRQQVREAAGLLERLIPAYLTGDGSLSVEQAGLLVACLQDPVVRDDLLLRYCRVGMPLPTRMRPETEPGLLPGPAPVEPADPQTEEAVQRLLVDLARQVEGPLAAAPLSVLGWHCWARGEGALARIAVDRALAEDPAYRLAGLLSAVLDHGIAPAWVGDARRDDEAAS